MGDIVDLNKYRKVKHAQTRSDIRRQITEKIVPPTTPPPDSISAWDIQKAVDEYAQFINWCEQTKEAFKLPGLYGIEHIMIFLGEATEEFTVGEDSLPAEVRARVQMVIDNRHRIIEVLTDIRAKLHDYQSRWAYVDKIAKLDVFASATFVDCQISHDICTLEELPDSFKHPYTIV